MSTSAKSRAEQQFTATQKKSNKALKRKEKAQQDVSEKMARLRALRLAKEAADKEAAEQAAAKQAAARTAGKPTSTNRDRHPHPRGADGN